MTIDQARLAGDAAYLRLPGSADVNLALPAGTPLPLPVATSLPLGEGMQLDVTTIDLLLQGPNLERLLARGPNSLLSLGVRKELFPGLFADPYRNRVHTIAGYEDLQRGTHARVEVLEIDGYPTLVSTDAGPCVWQSAIYQIPRPANAPAAAAAKFSAASWDLGSSRLAAREGLGYHLGLTVWAADGSQHPVMLAGDPILPSATPATPRFKDAGPGGILFEAVKFQVILEAVVGQDTSISERHFGEGLGHSLGRPMLRAVNLLEQVDGAFDFRSLQELAAASDDAQWLEKSDGTLTAISCKLPLAARLTQGEQVSIAVAPGAFTRVEARMEANLSLRPFDPDRKA